MISSAYQEIKSIFAADFLLAVFFPIALFVSANLAVYLEITQGLGNAMSQWQAVSLGNQILLFAAVFTVSVTCAYLVYHFQYSITQLFEGYRALPLMTRFLDRRRTFHQMRWENLRTSGSASDDALATLYLASAPVHNCAYKEYLVKDEATIVEERKKQIMPTLIGNILRASELYARDHYNMDATVIWPRLHPLLPDTAVAALAEKQTGLNLMLLTSSLAMIYSVIWCPVLLVFSRRWDLFLLVALGWPLAWLAYHGAITSAITYGEQVKATFDLYRLNLLDALHRAIPSDPQAECDEWESISYFFARNTNLAPNLQSGSWDDVAKRLSEYLKGLSASGGSHQS